MRAQRPRILLIADDEDSSVLTLNLLSQGEEIFDLEWAGTYEAGLTALRQGRHDACLLDYHLGARNGLELLQQAVAEGCQVPIIMLTGQADREVDLQAMKAGAADYLLKDELKGALLRRVLRYAIERRRNEEQRLRQEAHLRLVAEQLPAVLWTTDSQLQLTSSWGAGLAGARLWPDGTLGQTLFDYFQTQDLDHPIIAAHLRVVQGEAFSSALPWLGRIYHVRLEPLRRGQREVVGVIGVALDITEHERLQKEFQVARDIQQRLLPRTAPALPGLEIAGICHPAEATGGDFFDYVPMRDGSLGIVVADVSRHGFAPALIMAGARRLLRTLAQEYSDLGAILSAANRAVFEDTSSEVFVTAFFAQLDSRTRTLVWSAAGHEGYLLTPARAAKPAQYRITPGRGRSRRGSLWSVDPTRTGADPGTLD